MQNRTQNNDQPDTGDVIRTPKPEGVSDKQWADIKRETTKHLDELVELMREPRWCTESDPASHREYHSSDTVELEGSDAATPEAGWWCWLSQDRGKEVVLHLELHAGGGDVQLDPGDVEAVLEATASGESRAAILKLIGQIDYGRAS
jgi:hypothetical protein